MRILLRAALLVTTIFCGPAQAGPLAAEALTPANAPASAGARQGPVSQVAPIAYTARTLANGLRVYAIRDTTTANVSVQVWYDVGSKDDPRDRSGFAHLFEHLMFKATRNLASEQFDRLTEDVGGYNNASTADDYTNYYELVPAGHLERILFAEAERMGSLVVDPAVFASERDVVKEEYRQRVLATPYGKLFGYYWPLASYRVHPYARPGIGDIANLDAATIDDVRAFHATYYRPDNAVLVVAGNFDPAELDRWIDCYFAPIARPARPIPRVTVAEPPRTQAAGYTVYEPNTPLPGVLVSWQLPPARDPDIAPLKVLDAILSTGENSRLYRSLVYREQLAASAQTFLDLKQGTGALAAFVVVAGGKDAAGGEAALRREVAALRDAPVTAAELAEARNELLTQELRQRETAEGRASIVAEAVIQTGDPANAEREQAAIAAVTADDVRRVARKYLADNQSVAIRYLPAAAGKASDPIALATTVQVAPLVPPPGIAVVTPAPAGQRLAPPAPGPLVAADLPRATTQRLANGLTVVTVPKPGQPIVSALLVADGGGTLDRPGGAGAASLTADVMTKGTRRHDAASLAAATEALGTELVSNAGRDGATLGLTGRADALAPALAILADVAAAPALAPVEVERARAQAIDNARLAVAEPATLANLAAARAVFGAGSYGAPLDGTARSLATLTAADLRAVHRTTWRPDRTTLVLAGAITPAHALELARAHFGKWTAAPGAAPLLARAGRPDTPPAPRVIVIDQPDAGQAAVVVGRPALSRADPAYYRTLVANAVLGTGYSSRLNQEIRIKRGLSYGASSGVDARRDGGLAYAATQTKNASAAEVVALVTAELQRLGTEPLPAAEVETRKAVLAGNFGRNVETTAGLASTLAGYVTQRVPLTTLDRYTAEVAAVTPAEAQAAAARYLAPDAASIVVVGDAKAFLPALRRAYPALEVIPAAALNLDSPTLR